MVIYTIIGTCNHEVDFARVNSLNNTFLKFMAVILTHTPQFSG